MMNSNMGSKFAKVFTLKDSDESNLSALDFVRTHT